MLSRITDLVRIPPDQFHRETVEAVTHELNSKYANKVVPHVGLCISVYDVLEVAEGQLRPGDGGSYVRVICRLLVFKPFVGEIVTGWISQCTSEGVKVSLLGLFDEIFIPKNLLFEGSYYSPVDSAWVWPMDEETRLYFDINEKIRFRVEQEVFVDVKPPDPRQRSEDDGQTRAPAYALIGSCQTDGMGLVSWWE